MDRIKPRMNTAIWGMGFAALAFSAGCSGDSEAVGAGPDHAAVQVASEAKETGTGCDLGSAPGVKVEWADSSGEGTLVRVRNLREVGGVFKLTRSYVTTSGIESAEIGETEVGPGQSVVIPVPAGDHASTGKETSLHVVAKAEFADGEGSIGSVAMASSRAAAKAAAAIGPGDIPPGTGGPIIPSGKVNTQLCFEYPGQFNVPPYGEDYFTESDPTYRPARGMRINVWGPSSFRMKQYLDAEGCTSLQDFPIGVLDFRMYSSGEIGGDDFEVVDDASGGGVQTFDFKAWVIGASSPQTIKFDPTASDAAAAFNVAQVAGWVFKRLVRYGPPALTIVANANTSKSHYNSSSKTIKLEPGDEYSKWTIAHEMGHWALNSYTDFPTGNDCGSGHDAASIETQRCAINEGSANWWAAQAFNYIGQADCRYAKVDCDWGASSPYDCGSKDKLPSRVMETCHAGDDFSGRGNETDWSRMLWNMRSINGFSQWEVFDWIGTANDGTQWTSGNVYQLLKRRADAIGGSFKSRFVTYSGLNGIRHDP